MDQISPRQPSASAGQRADLTVVSRLAALLKDVQLDCQCRSRLDEALARFVSLEEQSTASGHLDAARQHRDRIHAALGFLQDLDELVAAEPDRSVYMDFTLLFEDIAATARAGSEAMRQLAAVPPSAEP